MTGGMNTRVPSMLAVIITFQVVSLMIVASRLIIRCRRGGKANGGFWLDDWLIIGAEITLLGCSLSKLMGIPYGSGKHMADLPPDTHFEKMLLVWYIAQVMYFATVGLIKMSILFFYLRLGTELRKAVYWVMSLVIATTTGTVLCAIFQCTPISQFWTPHGNGMCINMIAYGVATSAISMLSDVIIYILPMRTLWTVKLPKRQRLGLVFVFGIGGFVVITGVLRLHSLTLMSSTDDPTWVNVPVQLWSLVELNLAVICASLPSLKPLFARIVGLRHGSDSELPSLREYPSDHAPRQYRLRRNTGRSIWGSLLETQLISGSGIAFGQAEGHEVPVDGNREREVNKVTNSSVVTKVYRRISVFVKSAPVLAAVELGRFF